jgi:hypothetical protein
VRQAEWSSPVFDLRPDLRNAQSRIPNAQPIWRAGGLGAGGRMFILLDGLFSTPDATANLRILSREQAHPWDGNNLRYIQPWQDITTDVIGDRPCTLISFLPPGEGYPIRYWRVRIQFRVMAVHVADPAFTLDAAYY